MATAKKNDEPGTVVENSAQAEIEERRKRREEAVTVDGSEWKWEGDDG